MKFLCKNCNYLGSNTKFKTCGGNPILPNQCVFSGGPTTKSLPIIVNPDTPCELGWNCWKPIRNKTYKKVAE